MEQDNKCVFCGHDVRLESSFNSAQLQNSIYRCECDNCGAYRFTHKARLALPSILESYYRDRKYIISGYLREMSDKGSPIELSAGGDKLTDLIASIKVPRLMNKIDKLLLYLYKKTEFLSQWIPLPNQPAISYAKNEEELKQMACALESSGYLLINPQIEPWQCRVTVEGFNRAEELETGLIERSDIKLPCQATVYRILIASPSDVPEERRIIAEAISRWNDVHSLNAKAVLLPVRWETHAAPEMGDEPQAIINRQIVDSADILIGVFWTKLGTPTRHASSGSVEEIEEFIRSGKPVMLYFCNRPIEPDSIDTEQHARLREFRESCRSRGLYFTYDSTEQFKDLLNGHLTHIVFKLQEAAVETSSDRARQELALRQEMALRQEYILSHDGLSPGIMAGTEPLPASWVEERRKKLSWDK